MMKKFLVAMDGSEEAMHAAQVAFNLASSVGGSVTLAHVVPFVVVPTDVPIDTGQLTAEAQTAAEKMLSEAAARLGQPDAQRVCLNGTAGDALSELAEKENYDLVVVGSKGHNAITRVLVGSVTDRVVHVCKKPVLVVR
ncbi:MAG: universal stress protein [Archangium sp.]